MQRILSKTFGTRNDRVIKRIVPLVERIGCLEPALAKLSDADLRARTPEFRQRLENGEPLDDLLPEAFATVREAAKRTLGQRHYDVQMIGGVGGGFFGGLLLFFQHVFQAGLHLLAELSEPLRQLGVRQPLHLGFEPVDGLHPRLHALSLALVLRPENFRQ